MDITNNRPLRLCPFCGSTPVIKEIVIAKGVNTTGEIPEGAVLVKTDDNGRLVINGVRRQKRFFWERKGYGIHCKGLKCFCRNNTILFRTKEEAYDKWNKRAI